MRIPTLLFILASLFSGYVAAITIETYIYPTNEPLTIEIDIMKIPLKSIKAIPPCRKSSKKSAVDFEKNYPEKKEWKILWMDLNGDGICDGILQKGKMVRELAPHFPRLIPAVGIYVLSQGSGRPGGHVLGDGQENGWISVYYAEPNKPPFIIHYLKDVERWQPSMYVILRGDQRYIEYAAGGITAYGFDHEESDGFIARHYLLLSDYYHEWRKRTKKRDKNIERELYAMEANILDRECVEQHSKNPSH